MRYGLILAILFGFCFARGAHAADFDVYASAPGRSAIVFVNGELVADDHKRFIAKTIQLEDAIVVFSSPGGSVVAGVEMGKAIRLKDFATYVPEGQLCASACAIAWLGGTRRLMSRDARIGFHAAFTSSAGVQTESGMANAMVGAYYNSIGLPVRAVVFLTSAPPQGMRWLAPEDAEALGIPVKVFELSKSAPSNNVNKGPTSTTQLETSALEFVKAFHAEASQGPQRGVALVRLAYDDPIMFYGKLTDKAKILGEKERYFNRWPVSTYVPLRDTLRASCVEQICTVQGELEFRSSDYEQKRQSAGRAEFTYNLRHDGRRFWIVGENSKVLQRY